VDVAVGERGDVYFAEFRDAVDVFLVDQYPVDAGLDTGGYPAFPCLPIADLAVGFEPDASSHTPTSATAGLERGGTRVGLSAARQSGARRDMRIAGAISIGFPERSDRVLRRLLFICAQLS